MVLIDFVKVEVGLEGRLPEVLLLGQVGQHTWSTEAVRSSSDPVEDLERVVAAPEPALVGEQPGFV